MKIFRVITAQTGSLPAGVRKKPMQMPEDQKPNVFPEVDPELLRTLPPVLGAVVRALGFGRAKDFLTQHGSVNVIVPKRRCAGLGLEPDELARLREVLEPHMDAAGRVWMPKPDKLFIRVRDAQIKREKYNNSINGQARQYKLSSRHILNIRRETDDRQTDLF